MEYDGVLPAGAGDWYDGEIERRWWLVMGTLLGARNIAGRRRGR